MAITAAQNAPRKRSYILLVEDNKADVYLIREAIETAKIDAALRVLSDGEKAVRYFAEVGRDPSIVCPDLILLDINLPKRQGDDVLREMRKVPRCAHTRVVVVTSSDSDQERQEMARLGAADYFRKSSEYEDFMQLGELVRTILDRPFAS